VNKRRLYITLGVVAVLIAAVCVFSFIYPTHYPYNDRFVLGSTRDEIIAKYGEFWLEELNSQGELLEQNKTYYWQGQGVFNHIAPIIDTRLSKFSSITPNVSVRPKTDDDADVNAASLAEKLLENVSKKIELDKVVKKATVWSETCGTSFYKILWDSQGGNKIGEHQGKDIAVAFHHIVDHNRERIILLEQHLVFVF
jgi:hypothetical protein